MKKCTKCGVEKLKSEFSKNKRAKDGLQCCCKACASAHHAAHYAANREAVNARIAAYRTANPDKVKARKAAYCAANQEKVKAYHAEYRAAHREARNAQSAAWHVANREVRNAQIAAYQKANPGQKKARYAAYQKANPEKFSAFAAKRRASKLQATPAWSDFKAIEAIYAEAAALTKSTGIEHHVDHIVPLQSKLVCGLHVPANLRAIPAIENRSKSNHIWPDMP